MRQWLIRPSRVKSQMRVVLPSELAKSLEDVEQFLISWDGNQIILDPLTKGDKVVKL